MLEAPTRLDPVARQLDEYFTGRRRAFDVELDWSLSHGFRRTVLERLATDIGYGDLPQLRQTGPTVRLPQGRARRRHRLLDQSDPDRRAVSPGDPIRRNRRRLPRRPRRQARPARPRADHDDDGTAGRRATGFHRWARSSPSTGRGAWMGNRGRLHEGRGTRDVARNHQHKTWITCVLSFRGRQVPQWQPNRYTPLFFLDEAVALAAGHRPCAECRHGAYTTYRALFAETRGGATTYAKDMDTQLHLERTGGTEHRAPWAAFPTGCSSQPIPDPRWSSVTTWLSGTATTTPIAACWHVQSRAPRLC